LFPGKPMRQGNFSHAPFLPEKVINAAVK